MTYPEERALLVEVAQDVYGRHREKLEELKRDGEKLIQRSDFLWHRVVKAFAMWGGSSGWERLMADSENAARLEYDALVQLPTHVRYDAIKEVWERAGVRWPNRKTRYLDACFQLIQDMGGPEEAKRLLLEKHGAAAKMRFLRTLPGVGKKHARNIMMGAYHRDFIDTIAVDSRIRQISRQLGLVFTGYGDEERFYLRVAEDAGLSGWGLDRLMYNFREEFLEALEGKLRWKRSIP